MWISKPLRLPCNGLVIQNTDQRRPLSSEHRNKKVWNKIMDSPLKLFQNLKGFLFKRIQMQVVSGLEVRKSNLRFSNQALLTNL